MIPPIVETPMAATRSPRRPARRAKTANRIAPLVTINLLRPGDSIGVRYDSFLQGVRLVEAGLPFAAIDRFRRTTGLTLERVKEVARISEGSFARRKQSGRLSREESERLLRVARVFERATSLYDGDQEGARQWL